MIFIIQKTKALYIVDWWHRVQPFSVMCGFELNEHMPNLVLVIYQHIHKNWNVFILCQPNIGAHSNSHPDLLVTHPTPLFQITPVLNTGLSLSEPIQLYKGYNAITGLDVLASWMPHGFDWASIMMTWGHLGHYLGTTWGWLGDDLGTTLAKLGKTLAYSGTLWHTLA